MGAPGAGVAAPLPVVVKDRQVPTTTSRLANAQRAGAGNGGKSRGSARADNNQPKSGSEDVQNITWPRPI